MCTLWLFNFFVIVYIDNSRHRLSLYFFNDGRSCNLDEIIGLLRLSNLMVGWVI
jgi:hypothetical protein